MNGKKIKAGSLIDLIKKPCQAVNVEATTALEHSENRTNTKACDKQNSTFYHSAREQTDPHLTIKLEKTYFIKTITVVNVHTGDYCQTNDTKLKCIKRLDGATVEILKGK